MPDPVNGRDDRWSTDLGVVGALALWSVLFLLAPGYIGFGGPLRGACIVLAVLCGIVAAVGAGIAMEKLVQHEAFGYLGVALVFLGPAAGLGCLCGYELMNWARLWKCWPRSLCSLYLLREAALQSTGCAFSSSQSDPLKDPSRRWPAGQYFKA